jgi:spore germination protein YaaH
VDLSQYSIPVALSTARPDGDVVHEVKYGQTLWSIAIQYGTTIEQLKRLNNLTDDTVIQGWKLLVLKGATQPAPVTATPTAGVVAVRELSTPVPTMTAILAQETLPPFDTGYLLRQNSMVVVALLISFSVLVAGIVGFGKKKH